MNMLWTEKFRPQKLNEIRGQSGFVMDATEWVINGVMPNLLLHGVAGTGKTSAALVLAKSVHKSSLRIHFWEQLRLSGFF